MAFRAERARNAGRSSASIAAAFGTPGSCGGLLADRRSVEFDGAAVLAREEKRRDIVGFLHTHPGFLAQPSQRDIATMQAWVSAFGKPLLCLIHGTDGLAGYVFTADDSPGERVPQVESFTRGAIVAIDS